MKTASAPVKPLLALAALSLVTVTIAAFRPERTRPPKPMMWI